MTEQVNLRQSKQVKNILAFTITALENIVNFYYRASGYFTSPLVRQIKNYYNNPVLNNYF